MLRIGGAVLGLALGLAGLAAGQEVTAEQPAPGTTENRRVSQILGSTVRLDDGTGFGKVEDIVLGPDNRVEYLVVSHQEQLAMLPWTAGWFNPDLRLVTYRVTPEALQPMLFAPDAWPNIADPAFTRRVQTAFPQARLGREARREALRPAPATVPEDAPDPDRPRAKRKAARPAPATPPADAAPGAAAAPDAAPTTAGVPPGEKAKGKRKKGDVKVQP